MKVSDARIIVALDFSGAGDALLMADKLDPAHCKLKVGKALFTAAGPDLIGALKKRGYDIFLDLKFHDIPNTVSMACSVAMELGVWMISLHSSGGRRMMMAAREVIEKQPGNPLLIGVTVLTSLQESDLKDIGVSAAADEQVSRLAALTDECGLDGVVCSAREVRRLRNERGKDFLLVTPGIRPPDCEAGDQKRITTPGKAIDAGSHYLVMGRAITGADDPMAALLSVKKQSSGGQLSVSGRKEPQASEG